MTDPKTSSITKGLKDFFSQTSKITETKFHKIKGVSNSKVSEEQKQVSTKNRFTKTSEEPGSDTKPDVDPTQSGIGSNTQCKDQLQTTQIPKRTTQGKG